jgi:predicted transcriptional regulator
MSSPSPTSRDRSDAESVLCDPSDLTLPTPQQLRELRILSGLTIREVAEQADVSPDSVWRWEQGERSPRLSDVRTLVELYDENRNGQTQLR